MGNDRPSPSHRADARRNAARVLEAARTLFAAQGPMVPLDEIAKLAGVGNATMYRHFPTRQELIVAVYGEELNALVQLGGAVARTSPPYAALSTFMHALVLHIHEWRPLALTIADDEHRRSRRFTEWHTALTRTVEQLLRAAQATDEVRPEIETSDVLALAHGLTLAALPPDRIMRLLDLMLRANAPSPTA